MIGVRWSVFGVSRLTFIVCCSWYVGCSLLFDKIWVLFVRVACLRVLYVVCVVCVLIGVCCCCVV